MSKSNSSEPIPPSDANAAKKRSRRLPTMIAVAIVVLAIGAGCIWAFGIGGLDNGNSQVLDVPGGHREQVQMGKIVYAIRDIPAKQVIKAEDLEEREISVNKIPQAAFSSATAIVGLYALTNISEGQVILTENAGNLPIPATFEPEPHQKHGTSKTKKDKSK